MQALRRQIEAMMCIAVSVLLHQTPQIYWLFVVTYTNIVSFPDPQYGSRVHLLYREGSGNETDIYTEADAFVASLKPTICNG